MSTVTPRISAPLLAAAQAQKHVTHNEALLQLDALLNARLLDRDLSAPPVSFSDGDAYLIAANATGLWTGQSGKIAFAVDGAWRFYAPFAGLAAFIADESVMLVYTASGWKDWAGILNFQNVPLLGVATTADATNKFALKSNAALFAALETANGDTGSVQVKLNKETAGSTGSFLFQTNWSGRAEFGLTGDDDFHVKVSPDGAAWTDAVIVKPNGKVGFNTGAPASPLELHVNGGAVAASLISGDDFVISKESGAGGFAGVMAVDGTGMAGARMVFKGTRARGTLNAPLAALSGDMTFSLLGAGYDGAITRATAGITFLVSGAVSSGNVPQAIIFETGTAATRSERVRINSTGEMGIGKTATAGIALDVAGPVAVKSYTVTGVPAASAGAGQLIFVSNESGGAVIAFSDGTAWRRVTDRAVIS